MAWMDDYIKNVGFLTDENDKMKLIQKFKLELKYGFSDTLKPV